MRPRYHKRYRLLYLANPNLIMTSTFSLWRAMVMTHARAKCQGQRSVGSKKGVETDGRTDTTDCCTISSNAVGNDTHEDLALSVCNIDLKTLEQKIKKNVQNVKIKKTFKLHK